MFTNEQKRDAALYEVRMRKKVYGRFVTRGSMSQDQADRAINIMQEIADDYSAKCLTLFSTDQTLTQKPDAAI